MKVFRVLHKSTLRSQSLYICSGFRNPCFWKRVCGEPLWRSASPFHRFEHFKDAYDTVWVITRSVGVEYAKLVRLPFLVSAELKAQKSCSHLTKLKQCLSVWLVAYKKSSNIEKKVQSKLLFKKPGMMPCVYMPQLVPQDARKLTFRV